MLTEDDVDTLSDLFEIRATELELPDGTVEKVLVQLRGGAAAVLTPEEATALLDLVSEFSEALADEPGAEDDPDRVDYTGLERRLTTASRLLNPAQLKRRLMR